MMQHICCCGREAEGYVCVLHAPPPVVYFSAEISDEEWGRAKPFFPPQDGFVADESI